MQALVLYLIALGFVCGFCGDVDDRDQVVFSTDDPRVCGETGGAVLGLLSIKGPSPRRGVVCPLLRLTRWSIPALAGFRGSRVFDSGRSVNSRMRGFWVGPLGPFGGSPRVRHAADC